MNSLVYWENTSNDIKDLACNAIVIQPVGSVEQHGRHLPLGTDSLINIELTKRLADLLNSKGVKATFLPLIPYGKSNEHLSFPGTISFSAQTFMQILQEIGDSCAKSGFKKLVFLNTHGGNHEIIDFMTREIRIHTGIEVFALHPFIKIVPEKIELNPTEERWGIHAGQIETSIILEINEQLVKKELARRDYPEHIFERTYIDFSEKVPFGWLTEDISDSGVVGDPTLASPEQGQQLLESIVEVLSKVMLEIVEYRSQLSKELIK